MDLYLINEPNNLINKKLTNPLKIDINLRNDIDIINPRIRINFGAQLNYNYCYLKGLERYYFIDSIIKLRDNIYELYLSLDVLKTYSDKVNRSKGEFLNNISAGEFYNINPELSNVIIEKINSDIELSGECIILTTIG